MSATTFSVFAHLTADKAALYRAILGVFVAERARFVISLRPAEILAALGTVSSYQHSDLKSQIDAEGVQAALQQLCDWGNLDDTRDNAEAGSIEEFYLRRRLYQLSAAGEAAEQALAVFDEYLHRPGELQTTALHDIAELLDALLPRLADSPPDDAKLLHLLSSLVARFEQLTSRAQSFMRGLQSTVDLHGISVEAFLAYKEKLIDYLEKFIGELVVATSRIAEAILLLESCGVALAFAAAARRELADTLDPAPDAPALAESRWRERWAGLRRWFIAEDTPSQAELLRARARSAIPALLTAVSQINDRRASRADRAADFSTLARWFAEAPAEADCHRLWRAAFALPPARHLRINAETLAERATRAETPRTSWLEGAPVWLSPRLRQHGRTASRGPAAATIGRAARPPLRSAHLPQRPVRHAFACARPPTARRRRPSARPRGFRSGGNLDCPPRDGRGRRPTVALRGRRLSRRAARRSASLRRHAVDAVGPCAPHRVGHHTPRRARRGRLRLARDRPGARRAAVSRDRAHLPFDGGEYRQQPAVW